MLIISLYFYHLLSSWECCEDMTISAAAWIHGAVKTIVPAQPLADWSRWGDVDGRFHHDGNHTYMNPVPLAIRWSDAFANVLFILLFLY